MPGLGLRWFRLQVLLGKMGIESDDSREQGESERTDDESRSWSYKDPA